MKAVVDIKKDQEVYICDRCDNITNEAFFVHNDDSHTYCENCWGDLIAYGEMAAEAAIENEMERKREEGEI